MHVILATLGTDGDILPHLGLGAVLRERGHRVTLAAPETYRDPALRFDLEFASLVTTEEVGRMLAEPDLWHPFRSGLMMARWGNPMIPRHYELLSELARQPRSILVANPGILAARLVQEKLGCPMATLLLQPGMLPSSTAPPVLTGGLTIPAWFPLPLRKLVWLSVDSAGYFIVGRSLNRFRKKLGLRPVRRLFRWWLSPDLVICLFPAWFAPQQPDWPTQTRLAGFGRFEGTSSELEMDVRAFCEVGPPPVAFTLGTGMMHASAFFQAAVAACESLGTRGLLLTKYSDQIPNPLPPMIHHCRFAPFRALLPLCGAIVHHGGVGTTAAALEAGCPQLILPLAWDQPDNAARVQRLGCGAFLRSRQRSSQHMSEALAKLMTANVLDRCRGIASQASAKDGLQIAADLVETVLTTDFRDFP